MIHHRTLPRRIMLVSSFSLASVAFFPAIELTHVHRTDWLSEAAAGRKIYNKLADAHSAQHEVVGSRVHHTYLHRANGVYEDLWYQSSLVR